MLYHPGQISFLSTHSLYLMAMKLFLIIPIRKLGKKIIRALPCAEFLQKTTKDININFVLSKNIFDNFKNSLVPIFDRLNYFTSRMKFRLGNLLKACVGPKTTFFFWQHRPLSLPQQYVIRQL